MELLYRSGEYAAFLALLVAFALTFWPGRWCLPTAAILYSVGVLVSLGLLAYIGFFVVRFNYALSDSGHPNSAALIGLVMPIGVTVYAIAAIALLWPSIPQPQAIHWGKILHVMLFFLVAAVLLWALAQRTFGFLSEPLKWLVYGLLWFRIRESYPHFSGSPRHRELDTP